MKIDAILLTWMRNDTLPEVVSGLKKQSCIRDIYIWHNYLSDVKIDGVFNVYSEKNFKCRIRHSFALNLDADYILFLDDDFVIPEDYSKYIVEGIKKYGDHAVLGSDGVFVDIKKAKKTGLYYDWEGHPHVDKPLFVDIVKGRFHITRREYIARAFFYENKIDSPKEERETSDDVFINLAIQCAINKPSIVIPIPPFKELNLGGLYERDHHLLLRSDLVKRFINIGWRSKVSGTQKAILNSKIKIKTMMKDFLGKKCYTKNQQR